MMDMVQLLKAPQAGFEAEDDFEAVNVYCRERGWTDGLPIVPPTQERVERMLAYCNRAWDEPIAALPPRFGAATPLRLAANAVMAGCLPEHFPIVMLALEAMSDERFNLYGIQATTHPCAPLLIFNGPVAQELGINSGHNAFGPGVQANATIGRAIRLAQLNIGGARPGVGDMATHGSPAKYTYCIAENEVASPWEPLHVERGHARETTTVTVVGAEAPHNVNDHESLSAEGVMMTIAGTMAITGSNDVHFPSQQPVVVLGPEHANTIAQGGYSKADAKRFIQKHAWLPMGRFSTENIERRLKVMFKDRYANAGPDAPVYAVHNPDDIIIVVVGGAGKHSAFIPSFGGNTRSVTLALRRREGQIARSIKEFWNG